MSGAPPQWDLADDEEQRVWANRYTEALKAGMSPLEADTFAASTLDIGELRRLIDNGCDGPTAARILL